MKVFKGVMLFVLFGIVAFTIFVISRMPEMSIAFAIAAVGAAIVTELSALRNNKDK